MQPLRVIVGFFVVVASIVTIATSWSAAIPAASARRWSQISRVPRRALRALPATRRALWTTHSRLHSPVTVPASIPRVSLPLSSFDTLTDTEIRAQHLLLGETSPILAKVKVWSSHEPFSVESIDVILADAEPAVDAFILYDEERSFLGRAALDASAGARTYRAALRADAFIVPYREPKSLYVRAQLKHADDGGESGKSVRIDSIRVRGPGIWSSGDLSRTSDDTFPTFQTARARITAIRNIGLLQMPFVAGPSRTIARFAFVAERGDGRAEAQIQSLIFTLNASGNVTVDNAILFDQNGDIEHPCTVSSGAITCSAIPASLGTVGGMRTLSLRTDIAVVDDGANSFLQVSLDDPGTLTGSGALIWTDGTTTFGWIGFESPIIRGPFFGQ